MEFRIKGEVIYWRGPSPFYFVKIPIKVSNEIKLVSKEITYGWGLIPVLATVKEIEWSTSLFPKEGIYLLPLKKVIRESLKVDAGRILVVKMKLGR